MWNCLIKYYGPCLQPCLRHVPHVLAFGRPQQAEGSLRANESSTHTRTCFRSFVFLAWRRRGPVYRRSHSWNRHRDCGWLRCLHVLLAEVKRVETGKDLSGAWADAGRCRSKATSRGIYSSSATSFEEGSRTAGIISKLVVVSKKNAVMIMYFSLNFWNTDFRLATNLEMQNIFRDVSLLLNFRRVSQSKWSHWQPTASRLLRFRTDATAHVGARTPLVHTVPCEK